MSLARHHSRSFPRSVLSRGDALFLWYDVTLNAVRDNGPDLTARQLALLMTIYLTPGPHTVKSLSLHLDVTKAVITRALDTLGKYGLVTRARDPKDKRSVIASRTGPGSAYLSGFAETVRNVRREQLSGPTTEAA